VISAPRARYNQPWVSVMAQSPWAKEVP